MKSVFVIGLLFLVSTVTFGQCSDTDKKELEKFDHAWTDANARGDRAYLETIYADDYARTSPTGPANKKDIIEAAVQSAAQNKANPQGLAKLAADHFIITCTPNTATITHRTVITTPGGREETSYFRGVHFLEKRNGHWQVVSLANHPLDDSANLLLIQDEWNEATRTKDIAWFERNFTDDFTFVNVPSGELQKRDEWIASVKNSKTSLELVESSELQTRVSNDLGVLTGALHVKGRNAQDQPLDYNLRFTVTFVRRDGRWLVSAAHASRKQ
jgi:uncharacterized protein (TIGR02246 family)